MPIELLCVGLAGIWLIVQILLAAGPRALASGTSWAMGPRDERPAPVSERAQRMDRALANMRETFPVFAAAAIALVVADLTSALTGFGAVLYLIARVAYVPAYVFHVPAVRSLVWTAAMVGIAMVLAPFALALVP